MGAGDGFAGGGGAVGGANRVVARGAFTGSWDALGPSFLMCSLTHLSALVAVAT